ncbi:MerR family transcriptional regulator [Deinococcus roseus]|uniref:MerR family transcriptional regulator n=2 Tax=Deinococcus roseus TaxID=392414 RepID=A0ABQ2D020_9DEIO|nr:MerR family transcriptional regulator [Deinococcus roseus]
MDYSIEDITRLTGFSKHTLRYYEKAGLLDPIDRNTSGHRRYTEQDLGRLNFLGKLRTTGMSIQDMRLYIELLRQGDHTRVERLNILEHHHTQVSEQIAALQDALKAIEYKIQLYRKTSN